MISVQEVVIDPDMIAPKPFTVWRSVGKYVLGGFQSVTTAIPAFGPVQQANNKEVDMLSEADRVGGVRSFWWTEPIYTTRGYGAVENTTGAIAVGTGATYTLPVQPSSATVSVYVAGKLLTPAQYTLVGKVLTLSSATTGIVYVSWSIGYGAQPAARDIIEYYGEKYRILNTYYDPGGGYWKALGTRMAAA